MSIPLFWLMIHNSPEIFPWHAKLYLKFPSPETRSELRLCTVIFLIHTCAIFYFTHSTSWKCKDFLNEVFVVSLQATWPREAEVINYNRRKTSVAKFFNNTLYLSSLSAFVVHMSLCLIFYHLQTDIFLISILHHIMQQLPVENGKLNTTLYVCKIMVLYWFGNVGQIQPT